MTNALHLNRPGPRRARAVVPVPEPVAQYAPGHFMALVRLHNWPPRFCPQMQRTREVEQSEISRVNRERRVALGDTGTIFRLSEKSEAARLLRQVSAAAAARAGRQ